MIILIRTYCDFTYSYLLNIRLVVVCVLFCMFMILVHVLFCMISAINNYIEKDI